jgi:hypothetical protein
MSGNVTFDIGPTEDDTLHVTSVVANHLPYEGISLIESGQAGVGDAISEGMEPTLSVLTNPAIGSAKLRFSLASPGLARISAFDVTGRHVTTITERHYEAGLYEVTWDAAEMPRRAPGIYYFTLVAGDRSVTRPVILLR